MRTLSYLVVIFVLVLSHESLRGQQLMSPVNMLTYDADGVLLTPGQQLEALISEAESSPPTDIFVLAHGWNNSFADAYASYSTMTSLLREVAAEQGLIAADYRSLIIGVSWPSKAWESDSGRSLSSRAESDIATLYRTWSPKQSNGTYDSDIAAMEQLLAIPQERLTQAHYAHAGKLFQKYAIKPQEGSDPAGVSVTDDASAFQFDNGGRGLGGNITIRDGLRLFTYWQMKERAGIIGESGIRKLLDRLQAEFPQTKIHLCGHSFGSKMILACVSRGQALSRPIDTLVLLQGAVSFQALKPGIGGYDNVLSRVRGPLLVTFSSQDEALGVPYELASRWAGQTVEAGRTISTYAAMGRVGSNQGRGVSLLEYSPVDATDPYHFVSGIYDVDGSRLITGHSEFRNKSVAELIWRAVRPSTSGRGLLSLTTGRSLDNANMTSVAERARKVVVDNSESVDDAGVVRLYADTIQSLLPQSPSSRISSFGPAPLAIGLSGFTRSQFHSRDLSDRLQDALVDERFMLAKSYSSNVRQWIIDGRSGPLTGRVLNGLDCSRADESFKQCVAVGYRRKLAGAEWTWVGTGTLVRWNVVLTAAHVVPEGLDALSSDLRSERLKGYEFGVLVGSAIDAVNVRKIAAKVRVEHPEFSTSPVWKNDIAILQLVESVEPKDLSLADGTAALPIALGQANVWEAARVKDVILAGFGSCSADANPASYGKRRVAENVPIGLPLSEAESKILGCRFGYEFVAGGRGIDTCNGDSGGPVFFFNESDNKYYIVGVTSRASRIQLTLPRSGADVASAQSMPCGQGGMYQWVGPYLSTFIEPTINGLINDR